MPERVLVTGVAGFIGSHVAERLLSRGDRVVGVDNFDPFYPREEKERNLTAALENPSFRLVEANCTGLRALEDELAHDGFDVIVHLAAKAGVRPSLEDPVGYVESNVVGTQVLLELARRKGVERFIFGSSSSVYGNSPRVPFTEADVGCTPISPYAATKAAGEILCRTYHALYGLGVVALRFFTVYGPRQRPDLAIRKFATLMLRGDPLPVFGDGSSERDYTWIDDITSGVLAAVDRTARVPGECEVINLGGNRSVSLKRLIELLAAAVGSEARLDVQQVQPGDVVRTCADITKASKLLGYYPSVSIDEGIPRFVEWMRQAMAEYR